MEVVVPFYGALEHLTNCLDSLKNWPVIAVNDGPGKIPGAERLAQMYKIKLIEHPFNKGFIEACHTGVQATSSEFVLLLNSDVIANDKAIQQMYDQMKLNKNIAVMGCRLLFPNGTIQCAGVARSIEGIPYHPFMGLPGETPHACRSLFVNAVTGAVFMIRRRVWDEIGGFDRKYGKGVYEDVDYCWECRKRDYLVAYDGRVSMIHAMHGSYVKGQPYMFDMATENLTKLLMKYQLPSDEELFYGRLK